MNRLTLAAGLIIIGLTGAQAADLAARPYVKAPPMAAIYDWTGFYVGGNVGYGWGENTDPRLSLVNPGNVGNITSYLTTGLPGFASGNQYPNLNPNGVFGGLQFGYDKQFGKWVVGAVTDIQAADFRASRLVTTSFATTGANADESLSAKISWFGTLRGKVGYAANDWLFYGTGGLAYGRTESRIGLACTPGGLGCVGINFVGNAAETRVGWSAGAGVSKAFGTWNVGLEYLHVDLGRSSVTAFDTTGFLPTTTITQGQRFVVDTARLTVNYKFGSTPLVAKY
ncbi:outer membrane protein [Bradyrhizobium ganzhouense]|uniref:outer membrane protein n=1 Tax=Bradyrhizobium ganzhouense TaxID=1179767 RepID=UPI003CF19721